MIAEKDNWNFPKSAKWLLILILFLLLFMFSPLMIHAQQETFVPQCTRSAACQLNQSGSIAWTNGNQVWRFVPINPAVSVRIWIHNNNTTNPHTSQVIQVFETDNPNAPTLLQNADQWVQAAVIDNTIPGAQCVNVAANAPLTAPGANGKGTCYTIGMFAAQVAIRITGAATQAGSPDTFDIGIIQQAGNPGGPQPGNDGSYGTAPAVQLNLYQVSWFGSSGIGLPTAGPFSEICGSATKTVILLRAALTGLSTTATASGQLAMTKGTGQSTGGTSLNQVVQAGALRILNKTSPAPTIAYIENFTAGIPSGAQSLSANIANVFWASMNASTPTFQGGTLEFIQPNTNIILSGTADCVDFGGITTTLPGAGASYGFLVQWREQ